MDVLPFFVDRIDRNVIPRNLFRFTFGDIILDGLTIQYLLIKMCIEVVHTCSTSSADIDIRVRLQVIYDAGQPLFVVIINMLIHLIFRCASFSLLIDDIHHNSFLTISIITHCAVDDFIVNLFSRQLLRAASDIANNNTSVFQPISKLGDQDFFRVNLNQLSIADVIRDQLANKADELRQVYLTKLIEVDAEVCFIRHEDPINPTKLSFELSIIAAFDITIDGRHRIRVTLIIQCVCFTISPVVYVDKDSLFGITILIKTRIMDRLINHLNEQV